ncbi:MAG: hypothetical protein IKF90_01470 [Parasporobacterium sp.]|nr:hypothetical protein [Parasporobacterium sp.]
MKKGFVLKLSDEDYRKFSEKCFYDGISPEEVLEGFICDLIAGSKTRGSDERVLAEQYYDRCGYGLFNWE